MTPRRKPRGEREDESARSEREPREEEQPEEREPEEPDEEEQEEAAPAEAKMTLQQAAGHLRGITLAWRGLSMLNDAAESLMAAEYRLKTSRADLEELDKQVAARRTALGELDREMAARRTTLLSLDADRKQLLEDIRDAQRRARQEENDALAQRQVQEQDARNTLELALADLQQQRVTEEARLAKARLDLAEFMGTLGRA